jgi:YVTN family beta-propeller protein
MAGMSKHRAPRSRVRAAARVRSVAGSPGRFARPVVAVVVVAALIAAGVAGYALTSRARQGAASAPPSRPATTASAPLEAGTSPAASAPAADTASASPSPSPSAVAPSATTSPAAPPPAGPLVLEHTITGHLDDKSVVASGPGLFFAQNMMYLHTMNVYDRSYTLLKIIPDTVRLSDFGYPQYPGLYKGAPVEAAFTPDGKYAYVSNYSMYGTAPFDREGSDTCKLADHYPNSFVYRVDTATLTIDQVIEVGAVPKFLAVTPDGKDVLVSNWCSYSETVIDIASHRAIAQIPLGPYPRGIAIDPTSSTAYIAVMGGTRIAAIDLTTFSVSWITGVGSAPRHLAISPDGRWLYATINGDGVVDKVDLTTRTVVTRVATGDAPRSMAISPDGAYLYVVNYMSNTMSKVRTSDMRVVQSVATKADPIGITYDAATHRVWVACYSGTIMVFRDGADQD